MKRLVALVAVVAAACSSPGAGSGEDAVTVYAAASLTEVFTELGDGFQAAHPGVRVAFNFGGSSALAQQIDQGAPADVFAAASPATMEQVADSVDRPVTFARNRLEIAVPRGNPAGIAGLADFGREEVEIALCAQQVPCGAAAGEVFRRAGVTARPDTLEQDVKAALTKVRLGEVDAALVYRTDVRAAGGEVEGIEFPEAAQAVNDYPIAPLVRGAQRGRQFVDFVLSDAGRAALTGAGFEVP